MKILLLEEYSGFYKNLREGLIANGHDVTFIATQDRWKKIDGMDYVINSRFTGILGKLIRRVQLLRHLPKMKGFDVVLLINQSFLFQGLSSLTLWYLKKYNKKFFLSACGGDVQYANFGLARGYRYWPHDGCEHEITEIYLKSHAIRLNRKIAKVIDGVIPVTFEYAEAWRNSPYRHLVLPTIPLPINVDSITPALISFDQKIIFFHGLNREVFKGTPYIRKALENMASKYPDEIEVIIDGKLPLNEYLDLLRRVHVVIDSCKGYSYASMNTLYSMALSKIVMMTCTDECVSEFGLEEVPPIIAITPSVKHIEDQIEWIIRNKAKLQDLSISARFFVSEHHSCKLIAKKYVDQFQAI
jgi:glycosyltransferase involved in cell wall biosynthesis